MQRCSDVVLIVALTCWCLGGSGASALVVADVPFPTCPNGCAIDPWTGRPVPMYMMYGDQDSPTQFAVEGRQYEQFSELYDTTFVVRRGNPEAMRYTLPQLFSSTIGPDVILWQSVSAFSDLALDLSDIALEQNWTTIFPATILRSCMRGDAFIGMPARFSYWGIWYRKSQFAALGLSPPATWPEFLAVCAVLRANGVDTPVGLGSADLWQGMTWWEMVILRMAGAARYQTMVDGAVNFETDPLQRAAWATLQEMIDLGNFGPDIAATGPKDILAVLVEWALGGSAMVLMTGFADSVPAILGLNASAAADVDYFPFPTFSITSQDPQAGEFSSMTIWAVNSLAKSVPAARAWIRFAATLNFSLTQLPIMSGSAPSNIESHAAVMDPIMRRGLTMLQNTPTVFNMIDTEIPLFTKRTKPIMFLFFTGTLAAANQSVAAITREFEQARQEVLLGSVVNPTFSVPSLAVVAQSFQIELACDTPNSTIYFAIVNTVIQVATATVAAGVAPTSFYPYVTPLVLGAGEWEVLAYARSAESSDLLKDSATVRNTYTIVSPLAPVTQPVMYAQPPAILVAVAVFAILGISCAAGIGSLVFRHRGTQLLKASSPLFCALILVGCALGYVSTLMLVWYEPTPGVCVALPFVGHTAFAISFGGLFAKTWRLMVIFRQTRLEVMSITNVELLRSIGIGCAMAWLYLGVRVAELPAAKTRLQEADGQVFVVCAGCDSAWDWFVLVIEACVIAWGCYLAWSTRRNPQFFNESTWIALSIYSCTAFGGVGLVLTFSGIVARPDSVILLQVIFVMLVTTTTMLLVFVPKFVMLVTNGPNFSRYLTAPFQTGGGTNLTGGGGAAGGGGTRETGTAGGAGGGGAGGIGRDSSHGSGLTGGKSTVTPLQIVTTPPAAAGNWMGQPPAGTSTQHAANPHRVSATALSPSRHAHVNSPPSTASAAAAAAAAAAGAGAASNTGANAGPAGTTPKTVLVASRRLTHVATSPTSIAASGSASSTGQAPV